MISGLGLRLGTITAATFLTIGVHQPFFPVWLESRGLDAPTIGLVLAIPILVRILVTTPIVGLADGRLGPRRLLILATLCVTLTYAAFSFAQTLPLLVAVVVVMAIVHCPIIPITDLMVNDAVRRDSRIAYGRIRLWGSLGYLAATLFAGYLLEGAEADAILRLLVALAVLGFLSSLLAPADVAVPARRPEKGAGRPAFSPALWLLVAAGALVQASHAGVYGFGSVHWRALGYGKAAIAWFWIIGVICEIGLFWVLSRRMASGVAGGLGIVVGCAAAVVRFGGLALDPGPAATLALQALHAVSFGVSHLGMMAVLGALSPEGARGRAQGAYATATALAMAGAMLASGPLYRAFGAWLFAAMVPLALTGALLALTALRLLAAQPQSAGVGGETRPPS